MKSIFVSPISLSICSDLNQFLLVRMSNMTRVTNIAVNMLAIKPTVSVTAKPLIGPVPNLNNKIAAIIVVTFESNIAENAL